MRHGGTVQGRRRVDAPGAGAAGGEKYPVSDRACIHSSQCAREFRLFRRFKGSMTSPRDEDSRINAAPNFQLISPNFTCFQLVSPNFTSRPQGGACPQTAFPAKIVEVPLKAVPGSRQLAEIRGFLSFCILHSAFPSPLPCSTPPSSFYHL